MCYRTLWKIMLYMLQNTVKNNAICVTEHSENNALCVTENGENNAVCVTEHCEK